jgi:type I restriction enzyme M protein
VRPLLFEYAGRTGYSHLKVPATEIKSAIFSHKEFATFSSSVEALFAKWKDSHTRRLKRIAIGDRPKVLINELSEQLLETFQKVPLLDPYDVYQNVMDYWAESMQDDVYMLVQEGWSAVLEGKPNIDLIPPDLVIARFFSREQAEIEELETRRDAIGRQLQELEEEQGDEDGLLADARTDKGKLTLKSVKSRLKAITDDKDLEDERDVLDHYSALLEDQSDAGRKLREAEASLYPQVFTKYAQLGVPQIKTLVVDHKWFTALSAAAHSEMDRVSQTLTRRIRQLAERYATPLPELTQQAATLAARVDGHFKRMGAEWN